MYQWTYLYTDGSKNKDGVGAAIYTEGTSSSASLPKFSTIFTAEAHAIHMALNTISKSNKLTLATFSDSKSVLKAFQSRAPSNSKIRRIKHRLLVM